MRFLLICLGLFIFSQSLYAQKKHVCSITINSSDEIDYLKKTLNPDFYEFKELVPSPNQPYVLNWFDKACEANYRCDILVISGHFGGMFFGDSPYNLTVEKMFRKSCENSCPNILSAPEQVYLFGCNTLATKVMGNDRRTFESYYQTLLDHDYANDTAFQIATTRFSPIASTFSSQMRQIFKGREKQILGFSFISPLGPVNARMMSLAAKSARANFESVAYTDALLRTYHERKVEFTRMNGISDSEELDFYNKVCSMEDRNSDVVSKFDRIYELLSSERYMEALPGALFILNSFSDLNQKQFSQEEANALARIKGSFLIRSRLESVFKDLKKVPDAQVEIYKLIFKLGWMTRSDFAFKIGSVLGDLNRSDSPIKMDFLCKIQKKDPQFFTSSEFQSTHIRLSCKDYLGSPEYYSPGQFFGGVKKWRVLEYMEQNKDDLSLLNSFYRSEDPVVLKNISNILNFKRTPFGRAEDLSYLLSQLALGNFLKKNKLEKLINLAEISTIDAYHLYAIQINRPFNSEELGLLFEIPQNQLISRWTKAFFFTVLLTNNKDLTDPQLRLWLNSIAGDPEIYKGLREFLLKEYRSSQAITEFLQ